MVKTADGKLSASNDAPEGTFKAGRWQVKRASGRSVLGLIHELQIAGVGLQRCKARVEACPRKGVGGRILSAELHSARADGCSDRGFLCHPHPVTHAAHLRTQRSVCCRRAVLGGTQLRSARSSVHHHLQT